MKRKMLIMVHVTCTDSQYTIWHYKYKEFTCSEKYSAETIKQMNQKNRENLPIQFELI